MRTPRRFQCVLLLLVLILGQLSLVVHAADHIDNGSDQVCQLCHARSDCHAVLPGVEDFYPAFYSTYFYPLSIVEKPFARPVFGFSARAPPQSH